MKFYAIIDTYTKYIAIYMTKKELLVRYNFCKRVDSTLPFKIGDHLRLAIVWAPHMITRKEK